MNLQPSISAKGVKKSFKDIIAVDGLDLNVAPGEFVALLGPNGAGKSTLIEMLEGVQKPDDGEITISGLNWNEHSKELRNMVGISFQETRFMDKVTVEETLRLFASFYNAGGGMAQEVMKMVGLSEKRKSYVVNLSGGQRQKLALAISLINRPKILFLDEPTTGLDPGARREIWAILEQMRSTGATMILTTHYMEEAESLCEKILVMFQGKILAQGRLDELLGQYGVTQTIELELKKKPPGNWLDTVDGIDDWRAEESKVFIGSKNVPAVLPQLFSIAKQNKIEIMAIQCRKMTLDDLFILLTGTYLHE